SASIILSGIELIHMIRKGQMVTANDARNPSLAAQFDSLVA
ncbi:MAG: IS6 family transposase, partial [Sphingomonadaceae bacterium]